MFNKLNKLDNKIGFWKEYTQYDNRNLYEFSIAGACDGMKCVRPDNCNIHEFTIGEVCNDVITINFVETPENLFLNLVRCNVSTFIKENVLDYLIQKIESIVKE